MNQARIALQQQSALARQQARLESNTKFSRFIPPKRRETASLVDWVADHPAAKSSKSLRKLQEAYLESCGVL
jgi:hypothetical protein